MRGVDSGTFSRGAGDQRIQRNGRAAFTLLALGVLICLIAGSITGPSAEASFSQERAGGEARRPNVLIIMTDDQRDDLSTMPKTRELFEGKGTAYTNAFAATPNCCPSRASVFSGRYSHNHGVLTNQLAAKLDHSATLQSYLQREGYRTGLFGKFMNSWNAHNDPPYFDGWTVHKHGSGVYRDGTYSVNGDMRRIDQYGTDFLADRAVGFIEKSEETDGAPWLMYVTPNAPHHPADPEKSYMDAAVGPRPRTPAVNERDLSDKPPYVRANKSSSRGIELFRRRQMRSLMSVDDMVAKIYKAMRRMEESRDTIAIFTSDNGYFWGEHGLRGKWLPYEQAVSIPFIVRWPGHIAPGARDDRLVVNVDIAPTILDAAGIDQRRGAPMDGRSFLDGSSDRSRVLLEYTRRDPRGERAEVPTWQGVRTKAAAYTEYYGANGSVAFREYYDLREDPYELENLLADGDPTNDGSAERLQARLRTDRRCRGSSCP